VKLSILLRNLERLKVANAKNNCTHAARDALAISLARIHYLQEQGKSINITLELFEIAIFDQTLTKISALLLHSIPTINVNGYLVVVDTIRRSEHDHAMRNKSANVPSERLPKNGSSEYIGSPSSCIFDSPYAVRRDAMESLSVMFNLNLGTF
jgi:hypothetical protein